MLKIICLCLVIILAVESHTLTKLQNDADMQSALMPQELNPAFSPDQHGGRRIIVMVEDGPWKSLIPMPRTRRNSDVTELITLPQQSVANQVKKYSRIVTSVVLAISAVIEIVIYLIEA